MNSEQGQTTLEYALVAALVSVGVLSAVLLFGTNIIALASSKVDALIP